MGLRTSFDVRHPFFRPLWRRGVFVGVLGLWTVYEIANGNWIWALVFGAAVGYLAYEFFVIFDPEDYGDKGDAE